ncbi:MAG: coenzyme F420-0:L-glutamate ligase [Sedimentisphaerales bacterium]|nr:coenzyme F420-0:L-glutamate ligase [Sedimentisphaerales bacterium]
MKKVEILGLQTIPEIKAGDNLAKIICDCAKNENVDINEKDILVLTSKIVSKAMGLIRNKSDVKVSKKALRISQKTKKDPIWVQMILDAGHKIIAVIPLGGAITKYVVNGSADAEGSRALCDSEKCLFVTRSKTGSIHTCDAGIDGSNHPVGVVSLFPEDPDGEAAKIRAEIRKITGKNVACLLADTEVIPYGTIDTVVGSSGINPCSIMFGQKDKFGKPKFGGVDLVGLEMTAASALLFGQTDSGIPVTIIRGYGYQFDEKRNVANTLRFAEHDKDISDIARGVMRSTSYAIDGFGRRLFLRIASWFV